MRYHSTFLPASLLLRVGMRKTRSKYNGWCEGTKNQCHRVDGFGGTLTSNGSFEVVEIRS